MERALNQLSEILNRMIGLHRQLLDLVRSEKDVLIAAKLDEIQELTYSKQVMLSSIAESESLRLKTVGEIAVYLRQKPQELSLEQIIIAIQASQPPQAQKLRSLKNTLQILIKHIQEQNGENRRLVGESLQHVGRMKSNVIGQSMSRDETYSSSGKKISKTNDARLFNQEV